MNKVSIIGLALFLIVLPFSVLAQPSPKDAALVNTVMPTPVGSGARAMGTGGAFIAIADDATAAGWNPGGLVQLVLPEMTLVTTADTRSVDGQSTSFQDINYLSMSYPFSVGNVNIVTALNYQRLYDFYFDGDFDETINKTITIAETADNILANVYDLTYDERKKGATEINGSLGALSPAMAVQITPQFSIGFTYNFWSDGLVGRDYKYEYSHHREGTASYDAEDWLDLDGDCTCGGGFPCDWTKSWLSIIDDPSCLETFLADGGTGSFNFSSDVSETNKISFNGENFNVGLLWRVTPRWTLGAMYRSEFEADLEREQVLTTNAGTISSEYDETMRFPASYGVGVAFRYSDQLNFVADATQVEWDRFMLEKDDGEKINPVNGLPEKDADIEPVTTWRAGVEYLVIQPQYVVPIRGGFFYDPEPTTDDMDEYYGVAVGTGIVYDRMVLDLSYWYRWGEDVLISTSVDQNPNTGKINKIIEDRGDINRQMVMLSAILHFQ